METSNDALESPAPAAPRRRLGLLTLVVLVVLAAAAWFAWQAWRQQGAAVDDKVAVRAAQEAEIVGLRQQVEGFDSAISALGAQRGALRDRLNDSEASNRRLQEQIGGLSQRVEQLESAVTRLSRQQVSGRDAMLLDDTEMLLQLAAQRYELLHDMAGASRALALASRTLDGVGDASYAGVRQRIANEREQLAAATTQVSDLAVERVAALRGVWPDLPLKPLDQPAPVEQGVWARAWHAVSGLVRIRRDSAGEPADARVARQLAVLDLAGAQAALLDNDLANAHAALQRARTTLQRDLDVDDPAVASARADLDRLLDATAAVAAPVHLGAALTELRNVRGVQQAMMTAPDVAEPAPAGSSAP